MVQMTLKSLDMNFKYQQWLIMVELDLLTRLLTFSQTCIKISEIVYGSLDMIKKIQCSKVY